MNTLILTLVLLFSATSFAGEGTQAGGPGKQFIRTLKQDRSWERLFNQRSKYRINFPWIKIEGIGVHSTANKFCIKDDLLISGRVYNPCLGVTLLNSRAEQKKCKIPKISKLQTPVIYDKYDQYVDHSLPKFATIYELRTRKGEQVEINSFTKKFEIPKCKQ